MGLFHSAIAAFSLSFTVLFGQTEQDYPTYVQLNNNTRLYCYEFKHEDTLQTLVIKGIVFDDSNNVLQQFQILKIPEIGWFSMPASYRRNKVYSESVNYLNGQ